MKLCPTRTVTVEDPVADVARFVLQVLFLYNYIIIRYSTATVFFKYSNEQNVTRRTDNGSLRSTVKRKILSDPQKELQSIIMHLEEENRQLQIELLDIQGTKAERLQRHRATIESQLQRLKTLKVH